LIEALLSKVRAYQSGVLGNVSAPLQVIVMSATLPSLDPLATWLNAHTQSTQFRPIPVTESILCGTQLYDRSEHCSAPIDVAGVAGFKSPRPFSALPFSAFNAANHGVPSIPDLSISALLRSALSASASGQKLNALQSTEISKYQV
jgi:DNA polymerase theta